MKDVFRYDRTEELSAESNALLGKMPEDEKQDHVDFWFKFHWMDPPKRHPLRNKNNEPVRLNEVVDFSDDVLEENLREMFENLTRPENQSPQPQNRNRGNDSIPGIRHGNGDPILSGYPCKIVMKREHARKMQLIMDYTFKLRMMVRICGVGPEDDPTMLSSLRHSF
jgi:hypothetical protein